MRQNRQTETDGETKLADRQTVRQNRQTETDGATQNRQTETDSENINQISRVKIGLAHGS